MIALLNQYTGVLGAIAILFWLAALAALVKGIRSPRRPRVFLIALALIMASASFAWLNVELWFIDLRQDQAEELATAVQTRLEQQKQETEEAILEGEVPKDGLASKVNFAEDDLIDRVTGGMDKESIGEKVNEKLKKSGETNAAAAAAQPADYKQRGRVARMIKSVTSGKPKAGGTTNEVVKTGTNGVSAADEAADAMLVGRAEEGYIYLKSDQLELAKRIERWISWAIDWLRLAILLAILVDYATAFNLANNLRWPLPLSCPWLDSVSPKPRLLVIRPDQGESWRPEAFLRRAVRKGEKVVYFGEKSLWEGQTHLARIPFRGWQRWHVRIPRLGVVIPLPLPAFELWRLPILRYGQAGLPKGSEFAFESFWFDRYLPVITGGALCGTMLEDFLDLLYERRCTGAASARTLVLAWDCDVAPDAGILERLERYAPDLNLTVVVWARDQKG